MKDELDVKDAQLHAVIEQVSIQQNVSLLSMIIRINKLECLSQASLLEYFRIRLELPSIRICSWNYHLMLEKGQEALQGLTLKLAHTEHH
jgi:hypothetical protein